MMKKEFEVINRLKHPNIVEFITLIVTKNSYYYVFELVRGGDLKSHIDKKKSFTEFETQALFRQFGLALGYLNLQNIVHRDLKPANIMLNDKGELKITDFGVARFFNEQQGLMNTQCGTPFFQAPEVLQGQPYDEKADLWSVGIILFQMLTGRLPFPATSFYDLLNKVKIGRYELPADLPLSKYCTNLLTSLIICDPNKRISFTDFMKHPFIALTP
jgi:serine/threonine protein kinase